MSSSSTDHTLEKICLPVEATVDYYPNFITSEEATALFSVISQYASLEDNRLTVHGVSFDFGKVSFIDKELKETDAIPEAGHGKTMVWPEALLEIRQRIETLLNKIYRVCICIYYPDGNSGVDFHADRPSFGDTTVIASISLGAERQFLLRHKVTGEQHGLVLKHGSLLVMGEGCQDHYEHSLPVDSTCENPRINLTFRQFGYEE